MSYRSDAASTQDIVHVLGDDLLNRGASRRMAFCDDLKKELPDHE